jgi:4-diphosphocytidyl-2-C-methyl-D-erythritol kinase
MITKKAYAKINVGLRILRKREDGYHDLETIFHRVNIFDTITFNPAGEISIISSESLLPIDKSNLCVKTATILQEHYAVTKGVKIFLQKNIPLGAGLGGGSADAAATLLALNELWNLSLPHSEMQAVAALLGSDVPYFLKNGSAYATGRGELLEYFQLEIPYWILLVYPGVHVSTPWAYNQVKNKKEKVKKGFTALVYDLKKSASEINQLIENDFEEVVFPHYPVIANIKEQMIQLGAVFALMSGSGSSVYGFFQSEESAQKATQEFEDRYRVFLTPPNFQAEPV